MSRLTRWNNWTQAAKPSVYLGALNFAGELASECPPLAALVDVPQSKEWHPEGSAYSHSLCVVDAMARICTRDRVRAEDRRLYLYAALCHDFGKATTTKWNESKQKWTAYGHDVAGVAPTRTWLSELGFVGDAVRQICTLVRFHMVHCRSGKDQTPRAARKLMAKLKEFGVEWVDLFRLCEADGAGRPPIPTDPSPSLLELNRVVGDEFPGESYDLTGHEPLQRAERA